MTTLSDPTIGLLTEVAVDGLTADQPETLLLPDRRHGARLCFTHSPPGVSRSQTYRNRPHPVPCTGRGCSIGSTRVGSI